MQAPLSMGFSKAGILEWVAMELLLTQGLNQHLYVSCTGRQVLYHQPYLGSPTWCSIGLY